ATIMRSLGPSGLLCVAIFMFILILGLAYAWRKGALKWQ
ncbi:MAG: NADH-quinone oxidoreductase subunit A, partial [Muribaculaceae bacterium]|nr:NADH-quinone oxidoreductase subunit A [Muribaculaceae bacterium]